MSQELLYSGQPDNGTYWLVSGSGGASVVTVTGNATPGGDFFYTFGQGVGGEYRYQTATAAAGAYQVSMRARKTGSTAYTRLSAQQIGGAALQFEMRVNLNTGALISSSNITNLTNQYAIVDESTHWRIWFNVDLNSGTTGLRIRPHRAETFGSADLGDFQISTTTLGAGIVAYSRHPVVVTTPKWTSEVIYSEDGVVATGDITVSVNPNFDDDTSDYSETVALSAGVAEISDAAMGSIGATVVIYLENEDGLNMVLRDQTLVSA